MSKKAPTIKDFERRFPTEESCLDHLMRTRYGERFVCGGCGREARFYRIKARTCYGCEHCGYQVFPMAGTPFENTRTPLKTWFYVMWLFTTSRNGVAAKEVQRMTGVTYKTAWRMCNLIRKHMGAIDGDDPVGGPVEAGKIVEVDEAFIGGHDELGKNDKTAVIGALERGGNVITRVVPNIRKHHVAKAITDNVVPGAWIASDEGRSYVQLSDLGYLHATVNHSAGEYVRGAIHINSLESFWSGLKRSIHGTYVWVSPKHLPSYLAEHEYRWNLRKQPERMFDGLVSTFSAPHR